MPALRPIALSPRARAAADVVFPDDGVAPAMAIVSGRRIDGGGGGSPKPQRLRREPRLSARRPIGEITVSVSAPLWTRAATPPVDARWHGKRSSGTMASGAV